MNHLKTNIYQAKLFYFRFLYWIKNVRRSLPCFLLMLFSVLAFTIIGDKHSTLSPQVSSPLLQSIYAYSIMAMIIALFLLLLISMLLLVITPSQATRYENALRIIGLFPRYGISPKLIAKDPIKGTKAYLLIFYSLGISLDEWCKHQTDIEDVFNVTFVDQPHYGGRENRNRNIIVLTVSPGLSQNRKDTLFDDYI